ncbi:MAG: thiamine pyrophosphate-binding protein [Congregibacter sp.]
MDKPKAQFFTSTSKKNVAQLILEYLKLENVDHIFGIPGGGLKQLLQELRIQRDHFTYVICRQESGAAYMADGYHRATGKLGVVMVTSGPGATNALTGSMNAEADHSALLVITGEVPENFVGMGYLQEGIAGGLKMDALYRNAVRYSQMISNADNLHTLITQALRDSFDLPRHASHLSLPNDVAESSPSADNPVPFPKAVSNYRAISRPQNPEQMSEAFDLLMQAKRPLIFLGNGNRFTLRDDAETGERLRKFTAFTEKFAIPVITTPDGKALFPESHPMSLRTYGFASCEWTFLYLSDENEEHYDALLVIGSTLGELATRKWNSALIPNGPLIQINADHNVIGRSFPMQLGIVSDAGLAIDQLVAMGEDIAPNEHVEPRREFIGLIKQRSPFLHPEKMNSNASPVMPQTMSRIINEVLPPDSHIFIDGGNCIGWALHYMCIDPPMQIHNSLDMGPMGFGTCAVVGAKFGEPEKTCICLTGDGGFMMQGSEVSTAAQNNLGVIWLVQFNNDLGMVTQGNEHFFPTPARPSWADLYQLGNADLCTYAEGLGADAYRADCPGSLERHLKTALERATLHNKPQVVVVDIDKGEVPPYYQKPAVWEQSND